MAACVLVVIVVGAYLFLTSPRRLAQLTGGLLKGITGAEVRIGHAEFGLDGIIRLRDVELMVPDMPGDEKRLFAAREVLVRHDPMSLVRGRFTARSLTFSEPTLYLTEDSHSGTFNYNLLRRDETDEDRAMPAELPELFIRQGSIVRGEVQQGVYTPLFEFRVEGTLTEAETDEDAYYFALRQVDAAADGTPLRGRLNLRTMNVEVELDRFVVEARQGDMLPNRLRHWWQRMQPEGQFSAIRLSYDPEVQAFAAVLEVQDSALTLPWFKVEGDNKEDGEQALHPFRLTSVSGRFEMVNDRIRVVNLRGMLGDIQYVIDGHIDGLDADAPFDLSLRTQEFEIPEDPQFLSALPAAIRMAFDQFKPSGVFQLALQLSRERGGQFDYRGLVRMRNGRFTYQKFAYPLREVKGSILFNNDMIRIRDITARGLSGAEVHLAGEIAPVGREAAVDLRIKARQVPLDEYVFGALLPRHQAIIHIFGDEQALHRLESLGLVNGPDRPQFQLGGVTDYDITITRDLGPDKPIHTNVTLQMAGMHVLFRYWPYPLRLTGGTLHIQHDKVIADDITAVGLHGGGGVGRGWIDIVRDEAGQEHLEPHIELDARDLPLDELLFTAIPQPRDQWVRMLNLTGRVDARVDIFNNEQGRIDYRAYTTVRDATARPFGGGFAMDELAGTAIITSDGVVIESMQARRGESQLSIAGEVQANDEAWQLLLKLGGQNLRFEDPLVDLVPPEHPAATVLSELLATWKPAGTFNAQLDYQFHSKEGERYELYVEPHDIAFDLLGTRVSLTNGQGDVRIDPAAIELRNLGASFSSGAFEISGLVTRGEQRFANLQLSARGSHIDQTVRLVLPSPVLAAIDGLHLDGGYELRDGRLKLRGGTQDGSESASASAFSFTGDLHITGGQAEVGVPIENLSGVLSIYAAKRSQERWPRLDLTLHADHLTAADRAIAPLDMRLATTPRPGVIELMELEGSVYGGLLRGEGNIDLNGEGGYMFQLVLLDAPLDPIIHPQKYRQPRPNPEPAIAQSAPTVDNNGTLIIHPLRINRDEMRELLQTGRLSASLDIAMAMARPDSRRGRGMLEIRGARMYELPLAMAMLQILNLAAPASGAFDEANARFIVDGDRVLFDEVSITAPTIALTGDGTMRYSDRSLDLIMFSHNPRGPDLGPISDILNVLKDELLCVRVGGTLDDPRPQVINFRGIRESMNTLFGARRQRITPVTPSAAP